MNQQIANRKDGRAIVDMFTKRRETIAKALRNKGVTVDDFVSLGIDVFRQNPKLRECSEVSVWNCIMQAANGGLTIGGLRPQSYLVPFKTNCTLVVSYRGWLDLARRSGEIESVASGIVRDGDKFVPPDDPLDPKLIHQQSADPDRHEKPVTHAWVGFKLKNGTRIYDIMTAGEILEHASRYSKSYNKDDSPWKTSPEPMMLKTVMMRPIKRALIPMEDYAMKLAEIDDQVIDGSATLSTTSQELLGPVESEPIEHQEESPPDLDKSWFDEKLAKVKTGRELIEFRNEMLEMHPNDSQYIWEKCDDRTRNVSID